MIQRINKGDAGRFTFREYEKIGTTKLSDEMLDPGTVVGTLEGEYTCAEPSRLAIDVNGNVYPVAESARLKSYRLPPPPGQLERLLQALPRTADGVPIVPDMTVYCIVGEHVDERRVVGPYGRVALLTREPMRHGAGEGDAHRLAETVYSSREAALASAKKS